MDNNSTNTTVKLINPKFVDIDFLFKIKGFVNAGFPSSAGDYIEKKDSVVR